MSVVAMVETEYESIAGRNLENLREEVKPRDVELKKTRVDTEDDHV
jgi:hypothetical protein